MAKEKDVHVTNNINIKVDGEKKKKKRKSRKGKNKKSKKYMKTLADGRQYPHSGQIYSTGVSQAPPPPPKEEYDYDKFSKTYNTPSKNQLAIKDKERNLAIKDKERALAIEDRKRALAIEDRKRALAIKDADRSKAIISKTPTKKPVLDFDSYGKRVNKKIKDNAIILSQEYLGDPKNISIKKLKELMMSYGATRDQLKMFTQNSHRAQAVKVFLKTIEPKTDDEPVKVDVVYKSPLKGLKPSEESPMKSSKKSKSPSKKVESDLEAIRSGYETLKSDTYELFSPKRTKKKESDDEKEILSYDKLLQMSIKDFKKLATSLNFPEKELRSFRVKHQQIEYINKFLKHLEDKATISAKIDAKLPDKIEQYEKMILSDTPAFRPTIPMKISETPAQQPRMPAVDPAHHQTPAQPLNDTMVLGAPFTQDQVASTAVPFTAGGLSAIKEDDAEDQELHPFVDMRRGRGSNILATPIRLQDETPAKQAGPTPRRGGIFGSGARPPLSLSRRTPPQTTPLHENVEGKRGGRKVRDATPLGDFGLPVEPDHPFEQDNEI